MRDIHSLPRKVMPSAAPAGSLPLSATDVQRLLTDRTAEARIETMRKVVSELEGGRLDSREAEMAREVLMRFARDAEVAVREAVAWQVYNSPLLSADLARRLAEDVGSVAFPILRHVRKLTDELLLAMVAEGDVQKQVAVAGRAALSPVVADAIVESANLDAIGTLVRNPGADIRTPTLEKVVDRYGELPFLAEPLAQRADLPACIAERLLHLVSEEFQQLLAERHRLSPDIAAEVVGRGREAAAMLMLPPLLSRPGDMERLARHLHLHQRLTPSLLFRALCGGDIALFEAGMAVRADIAVENARTLLLDDGPLALKAVFEKARISTLLVPAFRSALKVLKEMGAPAEEGRRAFQVKMLGRVYKECGHIEERTVDDLLMQLFDQKTEAMIDEAMDMAGMPFLPLRLEDGFAQRG